MKDASFQVQRGADQSILFIVRTTEAGTTAKNLTGCTLRCVIAETATNTDYFFTSTVIVSIPDPQTVILAIPDVQVIELALPA